MQGWKGISVVSLLVFTGGCATHQLSHHDSADELAADSGWLAISAASPNQHLAFEITPTGLAGETFKTPLFERVHDLRIVQLPAGKYHLTGVYDRALIWKFVHPVALDNFAFEVQAGGLTMLGDLVLDFDTIALQPLSAKTHAQLEKWAPQLQADAMLTYTGGQDAAQARPWAISWRRCNGRIVAGAAACADASQASITRVDTR